MKTTTSPDLASVLVYSRHALLSSLFLAAALYGSAMSARGQAAPGSYWLAYHGLEAWEWDIDHDMDGLTARAEYYIGSDPWVWNPSTAIEFANESVDALAWESTAGVHYQPEVSSNLVAYEELGGVVLGTGLTIELPSGLEPSESERMFFRLSAATPDDADGDGLSSVEEGILGTRADDEDTDGDNRLDGHELFVTFSDPLVFDNPGATLRGKLFTDPNGDGDVGDGVPVPGSTVFLDTDFDGAFEPGEPNVQSDENGDYRFVDITPGLYHVRQVLPAPNVQTLPQGGSPPTFDLLPDEVVQYVHAAPGVGNFDEPYGENASSDPGVWGVVESDGGAAEPVSPDLVLGTIGVRNVVPPLLTYYGSAFLSLPMEAYVTVRFDEAIVDGPGPDLLIHAPTPPGSPAEEAEISVGSSEMALTSIGNRFQSEGVIEVDLADYSVPGPVHFVKVRSLNNLGSWRGFELVGFEVRNLAYPDPKAHILTVTGKESFEDLDFARYARDLPPTLILGITDNDPNTMGVREGETATVEIRPIDDFDGTMVNLSINGQPTALDASNRAVVSPTLPGIVHLEATATDAGGNSVTEVSRLYVLNADGSQPFDPQVPGLSVPGGEGEPEVRIVSPGAGTVSAQDVTILADIIGPSTATSWTVEYAPVDTVDPYDLAAGDPDYILLGSGTGNVYSAPVATLPLSTLADGIYLVRLRGGNAYYGHVIAKNVNGPELRPQVTIDSPAPGSSVAVHVDVEGTILSTRPLREWYVDVAYAGEVDLNNIGSSEGNWQRITSGTETIDTAAVLASLDATSMKNDGYLARIVAWNDIGLGWAEPLAFEVTGEVKLGRNRLEFTDISIDLDGFPLAFTRVYDSYQANDDGEMGYGWSIRLQDADIRETAPHTGASDLFGSTAFRDGTRVYITAPTGERLGFTFRAEVGASSFLGSIYRAVFEPDPGVYHHLEVPEGDQAFLTLRGDGSVYTFFIGLPYNPSTYHLTDPSGTRFTYHEGEGFLQATDANGNTITLNPNGIRHSTGASIDFSRDPQGRITSITSPGSNRWTFAYDGAGDLTSVTDPDHRVTTYHYLSSPAHYLDRIEDPLGRFPIRYAYDPVDGNLIAVVDAYGNRQEVDWDPSSFSGSVTSARGYTTHLVYDERGNVTWTSDPLSNVTVYAYDDPANPDRETSMTTPEGDTWSYTYDDRGRRTEQHPPIWVFPVPATTYNDMGQVTTSVDIAGRRATYTYDANGNLIGQTGDVLPHFEATYSAQGRRISVMESDVFQQFYAYDERGLLTGTSDTLGFDVATTVSEGGSLLGYAANDGSSVSMTRDFRGYPVTQTNDNGGVERFTDNGDGSYTAQDPNHLESTIHLDAEGRLTEAGRPGGATLSIVLNPAGNADTIADPLGNTFTFGYDPLDRWTSVTDEAGGTTQYEYNSLGLMSAIVTPSGKRSVFEYDENQRLTAEHWLGATSNVIHSIAYEYWGGSTRPQSVTEMGNGETHVHRFTGPPELPDTVETEYDGQTRFWIQYDWDHAGDGAVLPRRVKLSAIAGFPILLSDIRATYHNDRLYELIWGISGKGIRYERNPNGSVKTMHRSISFSADHSKTHFSYLPQGPVGSIRHEDPAGNLVHPNGQLDYLRDLGHRVTSMSHAGNTATMSYDSAGYLAGVTHTDASYPDENYTYDVAGNRLTSHLLAGNATIGAANRLADFGSLQFAYDAGGNLTTRTDTSTGEVLVFDYDHRDRLVLATVHASAGAPASTTVRYTYDFANRLAGREVNGVRTWIVYDRHMPMAEFADGATTATTTYFYSPDTLDDFHAVAHMGGGESWFLKDHQGSVRGTLDENGAFVSWVDYDAYGNALNTVTGATEVIRYAGRFYAEELDLYESRRRFYDPIMGRFTQPDPVHLQGGGSFNLYSYARNNPCSFTDPTGTTDALETAFNIADDMDNLASRIELANNIANCFLSLASFLTSGTGDSGPCTGNFPLPGPTPFPGAPGYTDFGP